MIVIVKYKTSNYIFFCAFNPTFTLQYIGALYCISSLTLFIVFGIISLFFILYVSSFLILLVLLWSLLKYLFLLRFLIWPLLPKLLSLRFLISWLLQLFPLIFSCSTKVYWLCAVPQFLYLLWYFIYRCCFNTSFTSFFLLVNPIIYFNSLVNKGPYIFRIFHQY